MPSISTSTVSPWLRNTGGVRPAPTPSGVPVAIIATPHVRKTGTKAGWLARRLLRHPKGKHWVRTYYSLRSVYQLKRSSLRGTSYRDLFQAGRSVEDIGSIEPAAAIVERYAAVLP